MANDFEFLNPGKLVDDEQYLKGERKKCRFRFDL